MYKLRKNNILVSILLLLGLTNYIFATSDLPVSTQTSDTQESVKDLNQTKDEKIEIMDEIKIKVESSNLPSDPKLKMGDACSDEELEEAQGKLFVEIPMAETIPCDKVDCKNLPKAKMYNDNYEKLRDAKTISCHKK